MFDKFGDTAVEVLYDAFSNSRRYKTDTISTEQILAALATNDDNIAARALASMNINAECVSAELERNLLTGKKKDIAPAKFEVCNLAVDQLKFSFSAKMVLKRAHEMRTFYGHPYVEPEHILLAMIDSRDESVMKTLEELGANVTYLNRLITGLLAERDALDPETQNLKTSVIKGLEELVDERISVIEDIERLAASTTVHIADMPQKPEIAHLVFTAFMPDFLFIQIGFQRYMLEETMKMLTKRAGSIDPEFAASTVSTSAQNLRADVRQTIEDVWSHEFRSLSKLPDEADYDLIGSVIEDLWWTHSEEIALNQVFHNAVDDHRRDQMLDLQKRRLEITERFVKLRSRLNDVIRQCFMKRTLSA